MDISQYLGYLWFGFKINGLSICSPLFFNKLTIEPPLILINRQNIRIQTYIYDISRQMLRHILTKVFAFLT